jgi:NifU-like protein
MLEQVQSTQIAALDTQAEAVKPTKFQLVEEAINELRPYLKADGGDCELVSVEDNIVKVRMKGACIGCQMASVTIHGVQERLIAKLGMPLRIIPVLGGH